MATVDRELKEAIDGLNRSVARLNAAAGAPKPPAPPAPPGEKDLIGGGRVNPPTLSAPGPLPDSLKESLASLGEVFDRLARTPGGPVDPPTVGNEGGLHDAIRTMTGAIDNLTRALAPEAGGAGTDSDKT